MNFKITKKNNKIPLPNGDVIEIPLGFYKNEDQLRKAVNKKLEKQGKPLRLTVDPKTGQDMVMRIPSKRPKSFDPEIHDILDEEVDWVLSDNLHPDEAFKAGLKVVVDYCEKSEETQAWSMAKKMYAMYREYVRPDWPSFEKYVAEHYGYAKIPATVRTGLILPRGL